MKKLLCSLLQWTELIPDNLLAKSQRRSRDRLLRVHTRYVLEHAFSLLDREGAAVDRLAELCSISRDRLLKATALVIATHDLGKATIRFQDVLRQDSRSHDYFHHALASFYLTNLAATSLHPLHEFTNGGSLEGLVVISHHHHLTEGLFSSFGDGRDHIAEEPDWVGIDALISLVVRLVDVLEGRLNVTRLRNITGNPSINGPGGLRDWFHDMEFSGKSLSCPLQELFVFLKGILQSADWMTSAGRSTLPSPVQPQPLLMEAGMSLFPHQERAAKVQGHLFVRLPTGTGKTEVALNWAVNQEKPKLAFLLPTTSTANQTYFRMRKRLGLFEQGIAGLLHGSVRFQSEIFAQGEVDLGKGFNLPYTVATVDQALLAMLNFGHWELKRFNLQESAIIVDEIHSYVGYTLALVAQLLKYLVDHGSRVCLMSATFPRAHHELFRKILPDAGLISLLNPIPPKCRYMGICMIRDVWRRLAGYRDAGKRVLMVANTVRRSTQLYLEATKLGMKPMLLHSQFTLQDRLDKEKQLHADSCPAVLISTQVVEVGIDIDFDVLFSEACPLTALVQRMGRVNRSGKKKKLADVWLFEASEFSNFIYTPQSIDFTIESLEKHQEVPLTEGILNPLVDASIGKLEDAEYDEGQKLLRNVKRNKGILHIADNDYMLTRKNEYLKLEVIPLALYEAAAQCETVLERTQYLVKIPLWWVSCGSVSICEAASKEIGLKVAQLSYSSDLGADMNHGNQGAVI